MAILNQGILGAVSGSIGPVSSYVRNGKNILRARRNSGIVKSTTARLAQREKIEICNAFTRAFTGTGFFNTTFSAYGHGGSGYNRATSSLMNLAIAGTYPGQYLVWQKVLIARGPLPPADNVSVVKDSSGNCIFHWTDNSGMGTARPTDKSILCAYCPSKKRAIFLLDAGTRNAEYAALNVAAFGNEEIATWIAFINAYGDVSDSVFGGMMSM